MGALELRAHLILQLSANEHLVGIDYLLNTIAIWQPKREKVYVSQNSKIRCALSSRAPIIQKTFF